MIKIQSSMSKHSPVSITALWSQESLCVCMRAVGGIAVIRCGAAICKLPAPFSGVSPGPFSADNIRCDMVIVMGRDFHVLATAGGGGVAHIAQPFQLSAVYGG